MAKVTPDYESSLEHLDSGQINELEMHSFLNLVHVVYSQLELLVEDNNKSTYLVEAMRLTKHLASESRKGKVDIFFPKHIREYKNVIRRTMHSLESHASDKAYLSEVREARSLLEYIFSVLDVRVDELCERISEPGEWKTFSVDDITDEFDAFFFTLEKNSNGRFRITQNIALQEKSDYLIHFDVDSTGGDTIKMPLLLKDVIRDLVANARKYTPPGGFIEAGVYQSAEKFRFVVTDNGIGIPEEELPHVFEYGYRASNAEHIRTMGGGFGLTKALHVVRQLNGEMSIDSTVGKGTRITIELPLPAEA